MSLQVFIVIAHMLKRSDSPVKTVALRCVLCKKEDENFFLLCHAIKIFDGPYLAMSCFFTSANHPHTHLVLLDDAPACCFALLAA